MRYLPIKIYTNPKAEFSRANEVLVVRTGARIRELSIQERATGAFADSEDVQVFNVNRTPKTLLVKSKDVVEKEYGNPRYTIFRIEEAEHNSLDLLAKRLGRT